jgi:hypothetical protein
MMNKDDIIRFISNVFSMLFMKNDDEGFRAPEIKLADEVKNAHREWLQCQEYFKCVSDPDLVDHAIFSEEAARRKYIYLLKKAREQA